MMRHARLIRALRVPRTDDELQQRMTMRSRRRELSGEEATEVWRRSIERDLAKQYAQQSRPVKPPLRITTGCHQGVLHIRITRAYSSSYISLDPLHVNPATAAAEDTSPVASTSTTPEPVLTPEQVDP